MVYSNDPIQNPKHPMSDSETMSQVVYMANSIVSAAHLIDATGGFTFVSCNDQGDPPYQGASGITFTIPPGVDGEKYFSQIADAMRRIGWSDGSPAGQALHGHVLKRDGVSASISFDFEHLARPNIGTIQIYGECNNTTDHHNDGKTETIDITAQIHDSSPAAPTTK